jgi:heterotetrameric sarcosine oxidase gamma subunit
MAHRTREPYKVSAVYHAHRALNAQWVECDGWRMPHAFGNPDEEAGRVRRAAGVQDVSAIGKLDLKGTAVDGRLAECEWLSGVRGVLHLKPGHALVLTAAGCEPSVKAAVAGVFAGSPGCVHITDVTSGLTALVLVGPRAGDVLAGLTAIDLRQEKFPDRSAAQCSLAHVHATIYRSDWADLPAYLILVGRDVGEYLWTSLQHAGEKAGLTPFGIAAEALLRGAGLASPSRAEAIVSERPVVGSS